MIPKPLILFILVLAGYSCALFGQNRKNASRNNLKLVTVYEEKTGSKPVKDSETKFDTQGNIVEETEFENQKITKHFKYEYDNEGNKTREISLDASGKIVKITITDYDSEGRKWKESETDQAGKCLKYTEYKYQGDLKTEKSVFDGNKKLKSKKSYKYQTFQ